MSEDPIGDDGLPDGRERFYYKRMHTEEEWAEVYELCKRARVEAPLLWPLGFQENVPMMVQITKDIAAAGFRISRGGSWDENDFVRELLAVWERSAKIADMHSKHVGAGGLTSGECNECGWVWPCPTYDWARQTSDRDPLLSPWSRSDDDDSDVAS